MAAKKLILKVKIDESSVLKQLGLANQYKTLVVTGEMTANEVEVQLLKLLSKGLLDEQKSILESDVGEFQLAEKVDGKITKRFESQDKPFNGMTEAPPNFIFAKKKGAKKFKNKSGASGGGTLSSKRDKHKRISVFASSGKEGKRGSISQATGAVLMGGTQSRGSRSSTVPERGDSGGSGGSAFSAAVDFPEKPKPDQAFLINIIQEALSGLGVPKEHQDPIIRNARAVAWEHSGNQVPVWRVCESLETIRDSFVNPGLLELSDIKKIVIAQRLIRTFLTTKRYQQYKKDFLPSPGSSEVPPMGRRLQLLPQMIKEEQDFRDQQYFLFTKVERPLKALSESSDSWINQEEWNLLFTESVNFRTIFGRLLKKLERFYDEDWPGLKWDLIAQSISSTLLDNSSLFHNMALRRSPAITFMENAFRKGDCSSFFSGLMQNANTAKHFKGGDIVGLDELIFSPLEHLKHLGDTLFRILDLTPRKRPERQVIDGAHISIAMLLKKIEENKTLSENKERLSGVTSAMTKLNGLDRTRFAFLPSGSRKFHFETDMTLLQKEKDKWKSHDVTILLFSDMLIITSGKTYNIEENGLCLLFQSTVESSFNTEEPKFPPDTVFRILIETAKDTKIEHILHCRENKDKLLMRISRVVMQNRLCFRRPLQQVVAHDGKQLPNIVTTVLSALRARNAQQLEGIFRIAGEYKYLTQMKALFDRWEKTHPPVALDNYDSFDIASLLKQWFRELPEPVLTYALYDKYVRNDDDIDFAEFLSDIPLLNRRVLLAVMTFNVELTKFSESNKMTPANVAICWGPTILRPAVDTMETSMRMPRVNKIVEQLVEYLAEHPQRLPSQSSSFEIPQKPRKEKGSFETTPRTPRKSKKKKGSSVDPSSAVLDSPGTKASAIDSPAIKASTGAVDSPAIKASALDSPGTKTSIDSPAIKASAIDSPAIKASGVDSPAIKAVDSPKPTRGGFRAVTPRSGSRANLGNVGLQRSSDHVAFTPMAERGGGSSVERSVGTFSHGLAAGMMNLPSFPPPPPSVQLQNQQQQQQRQSTSTSPRLSPKSPKSPKFASRQTLPRPVTSVLNPGDIPPPISPPKFRPHFTTHG